jgi:hypothetical protein
VLDMYVLVTHSFYEDRGSNNCVRCQSDSPCSVLSLLILRGIGGVYLEAFFCHESQVSNTFLVTGSVIVFIANQNFLCLALISWE